MKKYHYTAVLICLLLMTGCRQSEISGELNENMSSQLQDNISVKTIFVSGMGCSDPNCTDPNHYHDCPPDCSDYDHYHNCDPDCTEASHHHADIHHGNNQYPDSTPDAGVSFVSGMGCSDPDCTDPDHYHDCPPDCSDYDHHHNCDLDCTEANHHHRNTVNKSGQHHSERHHGGNHH